MVATVVITVLIVAFCIYNIIKMVRNVKAGRSIDGCSGDCSNCNGGHCR